MIKILVTVGAQLPFSRLLNAINELNNNNQYEIYAQMGEDDSEYNNLKTVKFLTSREYNEKLEWCDVVIAHAGMGTIIQCMELNKKLIVVPRLAKHHEHRNDHQLDTISRFEKMTTKASLFRVCERPENLRATLESLILTDSKSLFFEQGEAEHLSLGNYIKTLIDNEA